jgi:hypothetical protein
VSRTRFTALPLSIPRPSALSVARDLELPRKARKCAEPERMVTES